MIAAIVRFFSFIASSFSSSSNIKLLVPFFFSFSSSALFNFSLKILLVLLFPLLRCESKEKSGLLGLGPRQEFYDLHLHQDFQTHKVVLVPR